MLKVIFAPDFRAGVPYQQLLAEALRRCSLDVHFFSNYKRVLPLRRLIAQQQCDVFHLHWPEAYYPRRGDALDWFRSARFPFDLAGITKRCVLATTAHNFLPHDRSSEAFAERNVRFAHASASVIFAHSVIAKHRLVEAFALPGHKVQVVPHGDLSVALGEPVPASLARCELELGKEQFALMFGTVEPYKGLEEVIAWWRQARPAIKLAIVGRPCSREYGSHIAKQIGDANNIIHRLEWLSDHALRAWLSAADVVVFNYRKIFTSGAASLARSYGVPVLIPKRLDTVDLHEPTPYVCRFTDFASDFGWQLDAAASVKADFAAASLWRDSCSWDKVARTTAQAYRDAVGVRE